MSTNPDLVSDTLTTIRLTLADLLSRRGASAADGKDSGRMAVELRGGNIVDVTAFEPDPTTSRKPFYYNVKTNALYKRVVIGTGPGGIAACWRQVSQ